MLATAGGEVVDAGADVALETRKAVAVEDRRVVGPAQRELAHGALQVDIEDLPARVAVPEPVGEDDVFTARTLDLRANERRLTGTGLFPHDLEDLVRPVIEVGRVVRDGELTEELAPACTFRLGELLPLPAERSLGHVPEVERIRHRRCEAVEPTAIPERVGA